MGADAIAIYRRKHGLLSADEIRGVRERFDLTRRAILAPLGSIRLDTIARAVVRFHLSRRSTPTNANRCLALLSHMFNTAEKWGLRADGPCRHVERFRETSGAGFSPRTRWRAWARRSPGPRPAAASRPT